MSRRAAIADTLRNVHHPLTNNQRSTADVLVKITFADGSDTVEYASPGRAEYMLARYTPEAYAENPEKAYAKVERITA